MKLPRTPQRTTPRFAFSFVECALSECLGKRQFGHDEVSKVLEFFDVDPPQCAFCGSHDVKRWDHLIPVKQGGETVLGNMVLACALCDDSKRDLPFEKWIMSSYEGSPKTRGIRHLDQRVECIKGYMHHFGYMPLSLKERLQSHEWERIESIRSNLWDIRAEIDILIEQYRTRTGNK